MKTHILNSDIAGFVGFDVPTHELGWPGGVDPIPRTDGPERGATGIPRGEIRVRRRLDGRDG